MRSTKFTGALGAAIVKAKANGATNLAAAEAGGIDDRLLRKWLTAGDEGREPFKTFANGFRKAERAAKRKVVAAAARAIDKALKAAA